MILVIERSLSLLRPTISTFKRQQLVFKATLIGTTDFFSPHLIELICRLMILILNRPFLSNAVMTHAGLRLISSGAMYIFGRDKYYRPNLIFDQVKFRVLYNQDPKYVCAESVAQAFGFLWNYIRKTMFLEGHVDHWQATLDFGK